MTKTSKLKVRRDFGGNEFAWGEDVQAAAAAAAKSLQSWFSNKERPLLSTSQAGFSRKKVMHTRARFPCPGNGRDTSLILRHCEAGQKCWVLEVEWEKGAGLAGSAGVAVFVMPPGKKQDTEAVPPGTWVLPFVLRTGDKISWRTGGAFCHALLWYHHRQNVKTVSPSIDEGLSLHDKLLREGINILSFYLHCSLHSLSGVLAAGWRSYYWSKKWVCFFFLPFFFFFCHTVWHVGSQFPNQGLNLCLLHWKHAVSSTRPPRKSQTWVFTWSFVYCDYNPWVVGVVGGGKRAAQQQLWHFRLTRKTSG